MRRAVLVLFAFAAACGGPASAPEAPPVTIFAAASLRTALDDVDVRVLRPAGYATRLTYAGTPQLARQIEAGAPAEVFIAADERWMDDLQRKGHLQAGSRVPLVGNTLVLIAPATSRVKIDLARHHALRDALDDSRLAIADPETVPAGRYAREALTTHGRWTEVADRLAPHENVRAALALVARGEAPLGIVYASDAHDEPAVRVVHRFAATSHTPIRYPAALTARADRRAARVLALLQSADAHAVFARHGFEVPVS